jgi:Family of unknown function (DUF5309)
MSAITNTALSFSFAGITNREDILNQIFNIAPYNTPFITSIGKTRAENTLHEWQIDTLAAAATNAQLEGDDITSFDSVAVPTRPNNRTQILRKTLIVSKTEDAVKKAGMKRLFAYELVKKTKELKRDLEFAFTQNQAVVAGNSTTARQLRGFEHWIGDNQGAFNGTNNSRGTGGADAASATASLTDGTQRPLTENLLKPVLQTIADNGGEVDQIHVGSFNKSVISGFSGNVTRTQDTSDKKLVSALDIYVSDFGSHKVVYNRFSRKRTALLVDTGMWAKADLRPMNTVDLATTGDATKGMIIIETTLEARQEAASGVVADLTTS